MRAVFPDFLSGEIVVNADGSVRITFAQNAAGDGNACFVAVHFKTLVQHSAALASDRPVPVRYIGVGEGIDDLRPFNARAFVDALLD